MSYLIFSFILSHTFSKKDKYCNVLALEGGGDKGAYQAGAIKGLIDNLPSNKTDYDVVTGISVGSINAAAFSIFQIGKEKEAANFLLNTWREIKNRKTIYQNYWLGPLYGLLYKSGLYDTSPLEKFLIKNIQGKKIQKKIVIGSTNIENDTYVTWDENDFKKTDQLIKAVLASAAFPVLFPIREVDNVNYVDGGVKNNVDISSGINKCLEMGYEQNEVIVDTILCSGSEKLQDVNKKDLHPIQILMRILDIFGYDKTMKDVEDVPVNFPFVKLRYVISPTKKLPSSIVPLVFSQEDIEKMINIGIQDGIDAINNNSDEGNAMKLISNRREKRMEEHRQRGKKKNIDEYSTSSKEKLKFLK